MFQSNTQQAETPLRSPTSVLASRMDPPLKAKWVEALRSGEYAQGKTRLLTPEGSYCCLGVLCRVAGLPISKSGNAIVGVEEGQDDYQPIYDLLGKKKKIVASQLWRMNDGSPGSLEGDDGNTFPEIADWIEENL